MALIEKGQKMPIVLELVNFDTIYYSTHNTKILINDINIFTEENKKIIDNIISSKYSDDTISLIPSCECGHTKGAYYVGDMCPMCKTTVKINNDDNLAFLVWLKRPNGVEKIINPVVLSMLDSQFKVGRTTFYAIRWLMLPNYKITKDVIKSSNGLYYELDEALKANNIQRGYNSFIQNFWKIIDILKNLTHKKTIKNDEGEDLDTKGIENFLYKNKDKIFSDYMPFPNKVIFTYENNELGTFIDKSILNPLNVIRRLTGIDVSSKSDRIKQSRIAQSLIDISLFYKDYFDDVIFDREGLIRNHVISTRSHFSTRAVITSISGPHEYDELHMPWSASCSLFREHLLNKLMKRGFLYKDALSLIIFNTEIYNPILDEVFNEILHEHGNGVPVFFNRNPSLHRGSIQRHRITKIKKDPWDKTISFSLLVAKSYNADLDGDEMNLTLPLTKTISDSLENFSPHHNILSLQSPNSFSNVLSYPKPIISTIYNWLRSDR